MTDDDTFKLNITYDPNNPSWRDRSPYTRPIFDLPPNLPAGTYETELHPDGKYRLVEPQPQSSDDAVTDRLPHSRACKARPHPHGTECSPNCPTCHGRPISHTLPAKYHPSKIGKHAEFHPGWDGHPHPTVAGSTSPSTINAAKLRSLDAIISSSTLRLGMKDWDEVQSMLSRAYEDGRAQAGDPNG